MKRSGRQQPGNRRKGALIVVALVGVFLAMGIAASLLRSSLAEIELTLREQDRVQSDWLTQAGVSRGLARLARDENDRGEIWSVSSELLNGRESATVEISVARSEDSDDLVTLTVRSRYPADADLRSQQSRTLSVSLASLRQESENPE